MENIKIIFRHVPEEITSDFKSSIRKTDLGLRIFHDEKEYHNYTGGPADILIYFDQHLTDIIIGGVLYDFLKMPFISTWKKLIQFYKKKKIKIQSDNNFIEVNFKIENDKTIQFELKGDIDEKIIKCSVDKIFEYLKDKARHGKDLQNSSLLDKDSIKPKIRLQFNSETKKWQPVNFTAIRKQWEELMRRVDQDLIS